MHPLQPLQVSEFYTNSTSKMSEPHQGALQFLRTPGEITAEDELTLRRLQDRAGPPPRWALSAVTAWVTSSTDSMISIEDSAADLADHVETHWQSAIQALIGLCNEATDTTGEPVKVDPADAILGRIAAGRLDDATSSEGSSLYEDSFSVNDDSLVPPDLKSGLAYAKPAKDAALMHEREKGLLRETIPKNPRYPGPAPGGRASAPLRRQWEDTPLALGRNWGSDGLGQTDLEYNEVANKRDAFGMAMLGGPPFGPGPKTLAEMFPGIPDDIARADRLLIDRLYATVGEAAPVLGGMAAAPNEAFRQLRTIFRADRKARADAAFTTGTSPIFHAWAAFYHRHPRPAARSEALAQGAPWEVVGLLIGEALWRIRFRLASLVAQRRKLILAIAYPRGFADKKKAADKTPLDDKWTPEDDHDYLAECFTRREQLQLQSPVANAVVTESRAARQVSEMLMGTRSIVADVVKSTLRTARNKNNRSKKETGSKKSKKSKASGSNPGTAKSRDDASSDTKSKKNKGGRGKGNNRQDDAGTRPGGRSKRHQDPPNASGGESSS